MRRIIFGLAALVCPFSDFLSGQTANTTIQQTLASHQSGTATITWLRTLNDAVPRQPIYPGSLVLPITGGVINVSLPPNNVMLPPGTCYSVAYNLAGVKSTRYWFVPASPTPVNLDVVEGSVPCPSQAGALVSAGQISAANALSGYVLTFNGYYPAWAAPSGGGGGNPGGTNGQLQFNSLGAFGGFTVGGDCTLNRPNFTCTKTSGLSFAASATTDTTNASNINSGVLSVFLGGTGTISTFTQGSIVFAGAGGVYAQDNTGLFWDESTNRLGIGTTVPAGPLDIVGSASMIARITSTAGAAQVNLSGLSGGSIRNTGSGDFLIANANGFGGIIFGTQSASERMRLSPGGNLLIGGTADAGYRLQVLNSGLTGTAEFYDQTSVVGVTSVLIRAGSAQSVTPLVQFQDTTAALASQVGGDGTFAGMAGGVRTAVLFSNTFGLGSSGKLAFTSTGSWDAGAPDAAISRNGIGVLEINSGTPGALRDLKLRSLTTSSLSGSGPQCVSVDNTGLLSISGTGPCFMGSAFTPYSATVSAQTAVTILAAAHGRGVTPIATCLDNATPKNVVLCAYTRNVSGDLVFAFNPAFSGTLEVRQ